MLIRLAIWEEIDRIDPMPIYSRNGFENLPATGSSRKRQK